MSAAVCRGGERVSNKGKRLARTRNPAADSLLRTTVLMSSGMAEVPTAFTRSTSPSSFTVLCLSSAAFTLVTSLPQRRQINMMGGKKGE